MQWWCLRKKSVPEGYVTIIQDVYNNCETSVEYSRVYILISHSCRIASRVCITPTALYIKNILQMTVDGKRNRGRPKLRWQDVMKEDMARNQMITEMAEDQTHWHVKIQADTIRSVEANR